MVKFSNNFITKMMGGLTGFSILSLYKGVPPVGIESAPSTNTTQYQADLLAKFATTAMDVTSTGMLYFSATPIPVAAVGTGTATWFTLTLNTSTSTAAYVIVGTVGNMSTTAPLLMHTVDTVTGELVYVAQLGIQFKS